MATGMSDSTVKVFIVSKKQHDILTVDNMISKQVKDCTKNNQGQMNGNAAAKFEEEKETGNADVKKEKG